jgi:glycosyltransferase involved in cell wall biosynthesis
MAVEAGAVVVDDPKTGISDAINCGLAQRTDEQYYAWIGDDDLFRPGGLAKLQSLLEANPKAVLAYGGCDYIDPQGATIATSNATRPTMVSAQRFSMRLATASPSCGSAGTARAMTSP